MNGYNLVRLQPQQVLKAGDTMTGNLTMSGGAKFVGDLTGNADTSTKLATAQTINGMAFDGSKAIVTTYWGESRNIRVSDADGTNTGAAVSVNGANDVTLKLPPTIKSNLNGSATSATQLQNSRNINGRAFNGTQDITTVFWGEARDISVSDADGTNTGTAVSVNGDKNVTLKLPAKIKGSLNGNADSATKLENARTINGVLFDGTKDIVINPSGAATSADKLTNARNINGTPFNGTQDIVTTFWGNARNIVIGKASKPVDGSSDVTYTLREVGAAEYEYSANAMVGGDRVPTIFADNSEWFMTRSGGILPYKDEGAYLGIPARKFYDVNTVHINALHVGGHANNQRWQVVPVVNDQGVMEIGKYVDFHNSKASTSDFTFRLDNNGSTLFHSGALTQGSDRSLKENITYLTDKVQQPNKQGSFVDFIKNFKFATYNYKGAKEVNFGFIAQDIASSAVSEYMIREHTLVDFDPLTNAKIGETKCLAFDLGGYTSVVAKALQEEISLRESLQKQVELLEKEVKELKAKP